MKTPTIKITLEGPQGCGKTQLLSHLRDLLGANPFQPKGVLPPIMTLATHPFGDTPIRIEPPALAVVPLGENVTRCGLRARVLSNDSLGGYPIVAEVQSSPGSRNTILRHYKADGTSRAGSKLDLVGHRHPEIKDPEGLTAAERNEAGALLDAVKHCWGQMPADLAFNDLLMRRTPPKDWTPENLKLAKRANHYINEL